MVMEIALIPVVAGKEREFEAAAVQALDEVFPRAAGFVRGEVRRGVERAGVYALLLEWETIEDHTEGFVKSALFDQWVELTGGLIGGAPIVDHWDHLDL